MRTKGAASAVFDYVPTIEAERAATGIAHHGELAGLGRSFVPRC